MTTSQRIAELKKSCDAYEAVHREFTDTIELLELAEVENDDAMFGQLPMGLTIDCCSAKVTSGKIRKCSSGANILLDIQPLLAT